MTILEQVVARMESRKFKVVATKEVPGGWQVRFTQDRLVTVYKTGRVLVQGKWVVHTQSILGVEPGHKGKLLASRQGHTAR